MSEGKWRDARRQKAKRQETWAEIYQLEDEQEDEGKNGKKQKGN